MKNSWLVILILVLGLALCTPAWAVVWTVGSGDWIADAATVWNTGLPPSILDDVLIKTGYTVNFDRFWTGVTCKNITIEAGGELILKNVPIDTYPSKQLVIDGELWVEGTLTMKGIYDPIYEVSIKIKGEAVGLPDPELVHRIWIAEGGTFRAEGFDSIHKNCLISSLAEDHSADGYIGAHYKANLIHLKNCHIHHLGYHPLAPPYNPNHPHQHDLPKWHRAAVSIAGTTGGTLATIESCILENNLHGIHLGGCVGAHVVNNEVKDSLYCGIGVAGGSDNEIAFNKCHHNGRKGETFTPYIGTEGIYIINAPSSYIHNNECYNNGIGIHLWGIDSPFSENSTIEANEVHDNVPIAYWPGIGIRVKQARVITVKDNKALRNASYGIEIARCDAITVSGNTCQLNDGAGIRASEALGLPATYPNYVIKANICDSNLDGIVVGGTGRNIIGGWGGGPNDDTERNWCASNTRSGITLGGRNIMAVRNWCHGNGEYGIVAGGNYHLVLDNMCYSNAKSGIWAPGDKNYIASNYCFYNMDSGIYLDAPDIVLMGNWSSPSTQKYGLYANIGRNNLVIDDWYQKDALGCIKAENPELTLYNCILQEKSGNPEVVGPASPGFWVMSQKHRDYNWSPGDGLTKIWGHYKVGSTKKFNYDEQLYDTFTTPPSMYVRYTSNKRGMLNLTVNATCESLIWEAICTDGATSESITPDAVYFHVYWYTHDISVWPYAEKILDGSFTITKTETSKSYASPTGWVSFTISYWNPPGDGKSSYWTGDSFKFATVHQSEDQNKQKKLYLEESPIGTQFIVPSWKTVELKGLSGTYPTLISAPGSNKGFEVQGLGKIEAQNYIFDGMGGEGVKLAKNATITSMKYGAFQNQKGNQHLWLEGHPGLPLEIFDVCTFDASGTIDVKTTQDTEVVFRDYIHLRSTISDDVSSIVIWDPTLDWEGGIGFTTDGVEPNLGPDGSTFEFKVEYTDRGVALLGDAPTTQEVWVDLNDDGAYDSTEKFTMDPVYPAGTDYTSGQIYFTSEAISLPNHLKPLQPVELNYKFHFGNVNSTLGTQHVATGDPTQVHTFWVGIGTPCGLWFTDAGGTDKDTYSIMDNDIYVTVEDIDENTDSGSWEVVSVTISDPDTGDWEDMDLLETVPDSGEFRNTAGLASAVAKATVYPNNGVLETQDKHTIEVRYVDNDDSSDICYDSASMILPKLPGTGSSIKFMPSPGKGFTSFALAPEATGYVVGKDRVWVMVEDKDQNTDDEDFETIKATITIPSTGDKLENEVLVETTKDSGIFVNKVGIDTKFDYMANTQNRILEAMPYKPELGRERLEALEFQTIQAEYVDKDDSTDISTASVSLTPYAPPTPVTISYVDPQHKGAILIRYILTKEQEVSLWVMDIAGRVVARQTYPAGAIGGKAGINLVRWNGTDDFGVQVARGAYLYHLLTTEAGHKKVFAKGKIKYEGR